MNPVLKTLLLNVKVNLFNRYTAVNSSYCLIADGTFTSSPSYFRSDYIPVTPNVSYVQNNRTGNSNIGVAFYDINKAFISGFNTTILTSYITPQNCVYLVSTGRFSLGATIENFYLGIGTSV